MSRSETSANYLLVDNATNFQQKLYICSHGTAFDFAEALEKSGKLNEFYNRVKQVNKDFGIKDTNFEAWVRENAWKLGKRYDR